MPQRSTVLAALFLLFALVGVSVAQTASAPAHDIARDADSDPALLAPADAAVFIRLDHLAQWRRDWRDDPALSLLLDRLARQDDRGIWDIIQQALGMTGPEVFDTFFGQSVALIVKEPGDHKPGLVLTRIDPASGSLAVERLGLESAGKVGSFDLYRTPDAKAFFAFRGSWMALTGGEHIDYLKAVLGRDNPGRSLAQSDDFRRWVARLPDRRDGLLYVSNPDEQQTHALSLRRDGRSLVIDYAGRPPRLGQIAGHLGPARSLGFDPAPAGALAAVAFNIADNRPGPRPMIDRFIAPKTYANDIAPKIQGPIVAFLGEMPGNAVNPPTPFDLPVLGIAIRMKDASVAADLDQVMDKLLFLANVTTLQWKTDPVTVAAASVNGTAYKVADLGKPISQRARRPELAAGLQLTFGRFGDWYLLTSREELFKAVVRGDASAVRIVRPAPATTLALDGSPVTDHAAPTPSPITLSLTPPTRATPTGADPRPIFSARADPAGLAEHLRSWIEYGSRIAALHAPDGNDQPDMTADPDEPNALDSRASGGRPMRHLAGRLERARTVTDVMAGYRALSLSFWMSEDDTLRGSAIVTRR